MKVVKVYIERKNVQLSSGAGPAGMLGHSSMDGKTNTQLQNWIQIFSLILPLPGKFKQSFHMT